MIQYSRKQGGYLIIVQTILFLALAVSIIVAVINPIVSGFVSARSYAYSKQSFLAADSATEEAMYRLKNGKTIGSSVTVNLSSGSASVAISSSGGNRTITSAGSQNAFNRTIQVNLQLGTGISFHYGIQSGNGGFSFANTSSVIGNVFSSGPVTGSGNNVYGSVISAGSSGLISGIIATGTAYAHTIQNSTIGTAANPADAYYQSISNTYVSSTTASCTGNSHCHPGSADQVASALPISDAQISQWESDATIGGTATCSGGTYSVPNNATIGPLKVPCDLSINGASTTIAGAIWVTGNITIKGSAVHMGSDLSSQNVPIIADNPSNRTTSSIISIQTTSAFYAAGCPNACVPGAFVFMISQNNSAETGGSTVAIDPGQTSSGIIAYAAHGLINVGNSVYLKEVTAYKIALSNSANVTYDTGLGSSLFEAGPGGGYDTLGWSEI
jgi:hypothetical protein